MNTLFKQRLHALQQQYETLLQRQNTPLEDTNGIVRRYTFPVVTNGHIPLEWRYDLNPATNPFCLERIGVNACMNSGAIKWNGKYLLMVRVEGWDRKSFFAIAESPNGVDNFRFWERPVDLPDIDPAETNVYDMRLTAHEDGWIYGIFCSERHDPDAPPGDLSAAVAKAGLSAPKIWSTGKGYRICRPGASNVMLSCIPSLSMANTPCTPVRRMDLSQQAAVVA